MDAPEVPVTAESLDAFAGRYLLGDSRVLTVSREAARLYVSDGKSDRVHLVPIGPDLFEERGQHARYRFERDGGRIASVEIEPRILIGERARRVDAAH
jgi:hypothetical protein